MPCLMCASELSVSSTFKIDEQNKSKWTSSFLKLYDIDIDKNIGDNEWGIEKRNIWKIISDAFYCIYCFQDMGFLHDIYMTLKELESRVQHIKAAFHRKILNAITGQNKNEKHDPNSSQENCIIESLKARDYQSESVNIKQEVINLDFDLNANIEAPINNLFTRSESNTAELQHIKMYRQKLYSCLFSKQNSTMLMSKAVSLSMEPKSRITDDDLPMSQESALDANFEFDPESSQLVIYEHDANAKISKIPRMDTNKTAEPERNYDLGYRLPSQMEQSYYVYQQNHEHKRQNLNCQNQDNIQYTAIIQNLQSRSVNTPGTVTGTDFNLQKVSSTSVGIMHGDGHGFGQESANTNDGGSEQRTAVVESQPVSHSSSGARLLKEYCGSKRYYNLCHHCPYPACKFRFQEESQRDKHMLTFHQGVKCPYQCQLCSFTCFQFHQMESHERTHPASQLKNWYRNRRNMIVQRMKTVPSPIDPNPQPNQIHSQHQNKNSFQNAEYSVVNANPNVNGNFSATPSGPGNSNKIPFFCPFCIRDEFSCVEALRNHLKHHHPEGMRQCDKCKVVNTFWEATGSYDFHLYTYHRPEKKVLCNRCGQRYSYQQQLAEHEPKCNRPLLPVPITITLD